MAACPACGFENAQMAKFCSECGSRLGAVPEGRREERKVVSVVFVDLVGSTARAESSDPEDVRALLRVYHERARDELESFGGTVEKFIGDAVVAVFGAPVSHEDDPERAVRAALAVRGAVAALNEDEPGRDLHVRVAVNTGDALVSLDASPAEGEAMVAGDVINTAARIQSAAPVDGILVGEQTFRATDRAIVYRDTEPIEAKGKVEPVRVWEAVEPRARLGVDLGGAGRAELVGRDAELDLLVDALARSRRDHSTQLVTLVGVPGMGKSRLVYELLSGVVVPDEEIITWRQGRCLPYGDGVSYWALGEVVKAQAGVLESDASNVTESKLAAAVEVIADERERSWVERHLRPLVGLTGDDLTADSRGEAFAAWRRFLEAIAETGPAVLVFEDLHWADDGLLDFVDNLVDWVDGVPLLVVCTTRPELLDRRPGWGGGKRNATTVSLAPLADADAASLVLALLDRPLLDAEAQQALVARAAGNPLYAEEFVRMLEAGADVETAPPDSIQGIVAARIDLLPLAEKDVLQHAAVLGKVFWSDALASMAGREPWELTETLRSLERKEFVRREQRSAVAGASQHAFVHALVRDTAYGQLPRTARAARHLAAAEWIEALPDDRAEDRAETLAHHFVTVIELRRAAGESVTELGAKVSAALLEAGQRALSMAAYAIAVRYLEQALELVPEGEEPSAELLLAAGTALNVVGRTTDALARAVDAFERAGNPERAAEAAVQMSSYAWQRSSGETEAWLDRASSLVAGRPPTRAKALVAAHRARRTMFRYEAEQGMELAEAAVALARDVGDVQIEAHALITFGCGRVTLGDAGGTEDVERAVELVDRRGEVAGRGLINLGWAYAVIGNLPMAAPVLRLAIELAEREGREQGAWFARGNLVDTTYLLGEWGEALELIASFDAAPEGARYQLPLVRGVRAQIRAARDMLGDVLAESRDLIALAREGDASRLMASLTDHATLAVLHGLREEAMASLDEVTGYWSGRESVVDTQAHHISLVFALVSVDRLEDARAFVDRMTTGRWKEVCSAILEGQYQQAADLMQLTGERPLQAQLRLRAASAHVSEGRFAEAQEQLELARAFWQSVGATFFLRHADELFAEAS